MALKLHSFRAESDYDRVRYFQCEAELLAPC